MKKIFSRLAFVSIELIVAITIIAILAIMIKPHIFLSVEKAYLG